MTRTDSRKSQGNREAIPRYLSSSVTEGEVFQASRCVQAAKALAEMPPVIRTRSRRERGVIPCVMPGGSLVERREEIVKDFP